MGVNNPCASQDNKNQCQDGNQCNFPGPRTDQIYQTSNIPIRFMYPKLLKGYRELQGGHPHPCYRSSSMDYGWFSPTVHTVPTTYYPRDGTFSSEAGRGGMWRNCSLNTELDRH
ncbi:hypothetical protein QAD02_008773 [Eretmocerus hayati]|uniref:Uncharacterized protein n=1 Tax=Eretmocerus hayati TaxID=131215 RepID=A0ACC2N887_9HYME|nr:hypothetical protein QAD02_008773 [Eretmocerus hayati]